MSRKTIETEVRVDDFTGHTLHDEVGWTLTRASDGSQIDFQSMSALQDRLRHVIPTEFIDKYFN